MLSRVYLVTFVCEVIQRSFVVTPNSMSDEKMVGWLPHFVVIRTSGSKKIRHFTRKPDLCMNWFQVWESCTSISLISSPGMALNQWWDMRQDSWRSISCLGDRELVNLKPIYTSTTDSSATLHKKENRGGSLITMEGSYSLVGLSIIFTMFIHAWWYFCPLQFYVSDRSTYS